MKMANNEVSLLKRICVSVHFLMSEESASAPGDSSRTGGHSLTLHREGQVGYQSNVCSRERPGAGTAAQGWAVPVHGGVLSHGDVALRGGQWARGGSGVSEGFSSLSDSVESLIPVCVFL